MFFKITDPSTPAFEALSGFHSRLSALHEACRDFTARNGGTEYEWLDFFLGGVGAIKADNPPAGWRPLPRNGASWWTFDLRTKAGRALKEEATSLPRMTKYDIHNVLGYDYGQAFGRTDSGGVIRSTPGIQALEDGKGFLVNMHDSAKYTPLEGMVECTRAEAEVLNGGLVG